MTAQSSTDAGGYSIGAVARLTGISTHTLRIWERRYQTVVAERTSTGRRVYSRHDVEKLSLLKLLSDQGFSIGQIAGMSLEQLHDRRTEISGQFVAMQSGGARTPLTVAALTGFTLARLHQTSIPDGLKLITIESDYNRFRADVKNSSPDILLLEHPVIDADCARRISDLRAICNSPRIVLMFNFGHRNDIEELAASQVELFRSPVVLSNLFEKLLSGGTIAQAIAISTSHTDNEETTNGLLNEEIPQRRFSEAELSKISDRKSSVACECSNHLSDLIQSLTAFEVYCEQCESIDEEDYALHRYLHETTARARTAVEEALQTVVTAGRVSQS